MKPTILLLAVTAIILFSCTTAYKTGQTPDDVYFSPTMPQDEYVRTQKDNDNRYENVDDYYDDRYLRMKVHNRTRWSSLDDWYYYGGRYSFSYCESWNTPLNSYAYWNSYYNPYSSIYYYNPYSSIYLVNPKSNGIYNKPRTFDLSMYNGSFLTTGSNAVPRGSKSSGSDYYRYSQPRNSYNSNNSNNNNGSFLRNIFSNNNNSSRSSSNNNSSNSSSNSSSSSSSGSSSSPAPVRRF